jgi:hypothetical protein
VKALLDHELAPRIGDLLAGLEVLSDGPPSSR